MSNTEDSVFHTASPSKPSSFLYVVIAICALLFLAICISILLYLHGGDRRRRISRWCHLALPVHHARRLNGPGDLQPKRKSINSRGYWEYTDHEDTYGRRVHDIEMDSARASVPSGSVYSNSKQESSNRVRAFSGIPIVPIHEIGNVLDHHPMHNDIHLQSQRPRRHTSQQILPPSPSISPVSTSKSYTTSSISSLDINTPRSSNDRHDLPPSMPDRAKEHWTSALAGAAKNVFSNTSPYLLPSRRSNKSHTLSFACAGTDHSGIRVSQDQVQVSYPSIKAPLPSHTSVRGLASNMTYMGSAVTSCDSHAQLSQQLKPRPCASGTGLGSTQMTTAPPLSKEGKASGAHLASSNAPAQQPRRISSPVASSDIALRLQQSYRLTDRASIIRSRAAGLPAISKSSLSPLAPITPGNGTPELENFVEEARYGECWPLPMPSPSQHLKRSFPGGAECEDAGEYGDVSRAKKPRI